MRKLILIGTFILVISLFAAVVAMAKTDLARLEVINRSDQTVSISLIGDNSTYYLPTAAGTTKIYTIDRDVYTRTTWACGEVDSGTVNIKKHMRLVFTHCAGEAPYWGEPRQEKVHIDDAPDGINWLYK